jgi:hypothetical protein
LESKDPIKTYGFLHVYENRLEIHGEGDCISDVYVLDHLDQTYSKDDDSIGGQSNLL